MNNRSDHGTALLRISLGIIFIAHSLYLKLMVFTLPGTVGFFESLGLPAILAYITFAAEAIGGIALLVGFHARWAALALIPIALGATWAHSSFGWVFSSVGGGWEYPLFLTIASVTVALQGNGSFALQRN
ncbi:MAG: DoxX family protein [Porticoccus sp.]|nr:DoxX family protein [Porticoccus sp.]